MMVLLTRKLGDEMYCDICGRTNGHADGCPEKIELKRLYYCCQCDQPIIIGQKYIENDIGDLMHYDCAVDKSLMGLLSWLDYSVKIMEE